MSVRKEKPRSAVACNLPVAPRRVVAVRKQIVARTVRLVARLVQNAARTAGIAAKSVPAANSLS